MAIKEELTGNFRHTPLKRFLRKDVYVLEVEVTRWGTVPASRPDWPYDEDDRVIDGLYWREATFEDILFMEREFNQLR